LSGEFRASPKFHRRIAPLRVINFCTCFLKGRCLLSGRCVSWWCAAWRGAYPKELLLLLLYSSRIILAAIVICVCCGARRFVHERWRMCASCCVCVAAGGGGERINQMGEIEAVKVASLKKR